jgi:hypothetical protein
MRCLAAPSMLRPGLLAQDPRPPFPPRRRLPPMGAIRPRRLPTSSLPIHSPRNRCRRHPPQVAAPFREAHRGVAVSAPRALPRSSSWRALGTRITVFVKEPEALRDVCALVTGQLAELDLACSRFRDDSELVGLNRSAGRWVPVSPLLFEALKVALKAAQTTAGDVDPTDRPCVAPGGV